MANIGLRWHQFINKTFRDEIIDIRFPRQWWIEYRDVGKRLEGYIVPVVYKYKGNREICFCIDNDHLMLISNVRALNNALDFYVKTYEKLLHKKNENIK